MRFWKLALTAPLLAGVAGCKMVVMDPSGYVAAQQRDLILFATGLMLLIIVPVIGMTLAFAWKYRASNTQATYAPEWRHSTSLEVMIWGAPLMIILALGTVTWITSHTLDPYRPLDKIAADRPAPAGVKPLVVDVVALDWKWLFIYPEQGIATVNELAAPVDRPITFRLTSSSVMNSFYIPELAGQIYAMPGMHTQLHAVANKAGVFDGFSANYSGAGFSGMRFKMKAMPQADFDRWVADAKAAPARLDQASYAGLAKPTRDDPVRRFGGVQPGLFAAIVNQCAAPGSVCVAHTHAMGQARLDDDADLCLPTAQQFARNTAALPARPGAKAQ